MGKKRKTEEALIPSPPPPVTKSKSKRDNKIKKRKKDVSDSEMSEEESEEKVSAKAEEPFDRANLPPSEVLLKLVSRIEDQLPKDDHVKFDSRAKKLDWVKISWEEMDPATCKSNWNMIQERIRRFRIMAEMMADARTWISQPWTNFYKSKDQNRHPDLPKKPLSMYMLFLSLIHI